MDDMQRYREIEETADPDEPFDTFRRQLVVTFDRCIAECLRLEKKGKAGKLRAAGFTEVADELGM